MLEVCVTGAAAAGIAAAAGADRIELCRDLFCGGLTPTPEVLREVRARVAIPIVALIRGRPGEFVYSPAEQAAMLDDARRALDLGADGVAVGACRTDLALDWTFLERMAAAVRGGGAAQLVVHRVFDAVPDQDAAARRLVDLGFDRVLTSGGGERAVDSLPALAALEAAHGDRLEILPAGGITAASAGRILAATGCRQLHGSLRGGAGASADGEPCPHEIAAVGRILRETLAT